VKNIVELKLEMFGTHGLPVALLPSISLVENYFGYLVHKGSNRIEHQTYIPVGGEGKGGRCLGRTNHVHVSLNPQQPYGLVQACTGIDFMYLYLLYKPQLNTVTQNRNFVAFERTVAIRNY
jgi:hypothetical protein